MERYSANEMIDSLILGGTGGIYKHKYISDTAVPYCDKANKLICSPVLPPSIDTHADTLIRGKNYHEAGHARLTPGDKNPAWTPVKGMLMNALEDCRIERGISLLSPAVEQDLKYLNDHYIGKLQEQFRENPGKAKPINEAIMALHMEQNGHLHTWELSEKAQAYYDAVKGIYGEWKNADCQSEAGFAEIETLADRIIAIWDDMNNQGDSDQSGEGQGNGNDQQDNDQSKQGENENSGENSDSNQSGNADAGDDAENDEGQGNEGEGQDGQDADSDQSEEGQNGESGDDAGQNADAEQESEGQGNEGEGDAGNEDDGQEGEGQSSNDESNENGEKDEKANNNKKNAGRGNGGGKKENWQDEDADNSDMLAEEMEKEFEKITEANNEVFKGYKPYTAEDTFIRPDENRAGFEDAYGKIAGKIAVLSGYMEQALRTQSKNRNLCNRESGNLNMKAIHTIAKNISRNIFYTTVKGSSLDTTVTLLIDESGSIGSTKYIFRSIAIALSECLERIGIKFEVLGHSTAGHYPNMTSEQRQLFSRILPINYYEHKRFNESYRKEKYRLGAIGSFNCNVDGEVLLEAFKRANQQRASRHIILVLSDGMPSGCKSSLVSENNLTQMIDYCRKSGTEVYAFGIETNDPKKLYGEKNFIYIENARNLSGSFFTGLANIIINGKLK